jgi:glutamate racemase
MIGVFDSGLGGLTVLRAFFRRLPQVDYLYVGDNARGPYGNKSLDLIYDYTRQAVEFLFKSGCVLIILACNTASANALRKIQQEWIPLHYPDRRVLGVVIPLAEAGIHVTRYGRIGVIGTRATIESGVYEQELRKLRSDLKVYGLPCPLLVPLVEEGWVGRPETHRILKKYLRHFKDRKVDTLLLGCTHYPFLQKDIERIMGKTCKVLDGPEIVADKLEDYLHRHPEIESRVTKNGKRAFFTTDDPGRFKLLGERFLSQDIPEVEKLTLG